ncbi:MAG: RNA polymerase sigma factor [Candidatus Omnitrophota bacterium]
MREIPRDILNRAANGDINAFESLYRDACGFAYSVALRITCNKEDAEEVIQDAFIKIYKDLKNFEFKSSFKTWVYRIVANTAINLTKKKLKGTQGHIEYDDGIDARASQEASRVKIEEHEKKDLVSSLLSGLNPDHRACVVLRNIQGLSYQEIADTLNINLNTVRTRLRRAREAISARFKEKR